MKKIAVITPYYNEDLNLIKKANESVLNQRNEDNLKNELLIILSEELQKELSSEVYPERLDFLFETINAQGSF